MTPDLFFKYAVWEALLWSTADFFLIFYFLKFCDQIRKLNYLHQYRYLYWLLFFSVVWIPLLFFTKDLSEYLLVEIIIINIHYFIAVYLIVKNGKQIKDYFVKALES